MQMWELVARERIRDTLALYNWSGDAGRIENLTQSFCPDGELEVRGTATAAGRTAIAEFLGGHAASVDLGAVLLHQLVEDGVAVGEEPVQRGIGHPGTVGDRAGGGRIDALLVSDGRGRVENAAQGSDRQRVAKAAAAQGGLCRDAPVQHRQGPVHLQPVPASSQAGTASSTRSTSRRCPRASTSTPTSTPATTRGIIAQQLLAEQAERIASLALINSVGFGSEVTLLLRMLTMPVLGALSTRRPSRMSAVLFERSIHADKAVATKERIDHAFAVGSQPGVSAALRETALELGTPRGVKPQWRRELAVAVVRTPGQR